MEAKVEQEFKGVINGVEMSDSKQYYAVQDIIGALEDEFYINVDNKEFTQAMYDAFDELRSKNDQIDLEQYVHGTINRIHEIKDSKDFAIINEWQEEPVYDFHESLEGEFNKNYHDGKYSLVKTLEDIDEQEFELSIAPLAKEITNLAARLDKDTFIAQNMPLTKYEKMNNDLYQEVLQTSLTIPEDSSLTQKAGNFLQKTLLAQERTGEKKSIATDEFLSKFNKFNDKLDELIKTKRMEDAIDPIIDEFKKLDKPGRETPKLTLYVVNNDYEFSIVDGTMEQRNTGYTAMEEKDADKFLKMLKEKIVNLQKERAGKEVPLTTNVLIENTLDQDKVEAHFSIPIPEGSKLDESNHIANEVKEELENQLKKTTPHINNYEQDTYVKRIGVDNEKKQLNICYLDKDHLLKIKNKFDGLNLNVVTTKGDSNLKLDQFEKKYENMNAACLFKQAMFNVPEQKIESLENYYYLDDKIFKKRENLADVGQYLPPNRKEIESIYKGLDDDYIREAKNNMINEEMGFISGTGPASPGRLAALMTTAEALYDTGNLDNDIEKLSKVYSLVKDRIQRDPTNELTNEDKRTLLKHIENTKKQIIETVEIQYLGNQDQSYKESIKETLYKKPIAEKTKETIYKKAKDAVKTAASKLTIQKQESNTNDLSR